MRAIQMGQLTDRALQEALASYQQLWSQVEVVEQELRAAPDKVRTPRGKVKYDQAVIRDFVTHLPEALQADVTRGREFLRETLAQIRVEDGETRPTVCPVCGEVQGKINPQHMKTHGLTVKESYRRFPGLGFSKKARLLVQPSQEGILRNAQVFGLKVAGAGFEPATFGL
jgi:hypothetical protein